MYKRQIQHVAPDEGLWGTSVKERHATKRREGVSSAVNRDLRDNEASSSVVMPPTKQGPRSDSVRKGLTPGTTVKNSILLSAGASEKRVETPKEDLGKGEPEP